MQWFVNTGEGVETFDSREAAEKAALNAIDDWRDCCDPNWPEEISNVCFGPILGHAAEVESEGDGDDFYVDYVLEQEPTSDVQRELGVQVPFDGETRFILGMVCFVAAKYSPFLRARGYDIPCKAEMEQAATIHWMLNLYLLHGSNWRTVASCWPSHFKPFVHASICSSATTASESSD